MIRLQTAVDTSGRVGDSSGIFPRRFRSEVSRRGRCMRRVESARCATIGAEPAEDCATCISPGCLRMLVFLLVVICWVCSLVAAAFCLVYRLPDADKRRVQGLSSHHPTCSRAQLPPTSQLERARDASPAAHHQASSKGPIATDARYLVTTSLIGRWTSGPVTPSPTPPDYETARVLSVESSL